jgi:hypothetical protein
VGKYNLVISKNLFCWVHVTNLQCRSDAERHVPLSTDPLGSIKGRREGALPYTLFFAPTRFGKMNIPVNTITIGRIISWLYMEAALHNIRGAYR